MQASPFVSQHKQPSMAKIFVPTTQTPIWGATEMLEKHASHWFSKLLCCYKRLVQFPNSPGAEAGGGDARRSSYKPQEIGGFSPMR
jgi:hypothetical protein